MKDENLLSWNLANFVSIVLMVAIIWTILGAAGHVFIRSRATPSTASGKSWNKLNAVQVAAA